MKKMDFQNNILLYGCTLLIPRPENMYYDKGLANFLADPLSFMPIFGRYMAGKWPKAYLGLCFFISSAFNSSSVFA